MSENWVPALDVKQANAQYEHIAPDGSEIRLLAKVSRGNMAHCVLPVGCTSEATKHKTIEEIWFFVSGEGRLWRKLGDQEEIIQVKAGVSTNNPTGTSFQFQNTGNEPLVFVTVAMPPWPGDDEAILQKGPWEVKLTG